MKKLALTTALSVSMITLAAQAARADYTLNIMHINDWHSRIESINRFDSTCSAEDEQEGKCFGGAARLVTAVAETRKKHEGGNVLFLNAGDNFQGSLFYTTYKGAAEAEFLNLMKTDVMAVGNHEFDDGEDGLAGFLDKVEFPVLSSNILASHSSALGDRVKPSVVLEVGGEKIGVIGAVANDTADLSSPGDQVLITEDVDGITAAVQALQAEGVNKIIALTHVGYPRDLAAIATIPGIDVVVGGHSHTLLANDNDKAAGPYPTWVDNPDGYKVPVVQAASYSKYLGDVAVTFDDNGVVTAASGDPILLDASFAPDEAVLTRIAELGAPIEELKARRVSETSEPIDGSRDNCRARECQMGNLVADAMLDRVMDQGIQIAVQNGGGLRASIDSGDITMGEVLTVLPFQNTLATFLLSGADVVTSLESGVSQVEEGKGRFPQVSGLRYTFDLNRAPNEGRISNVEVKDGDAWAAIDPAKMYGVVSNNFMRGGGDGYGLFASNAQNAYDYGPGLEQVVADYLANNQPYRPYLDGRITEIAMAKMDDATMEKTEDAAMEKTEEVAITTPELPGASNTLTTEPPMVAAEEKAEMKMEAKVGDDGMEKKDETMAMEKKDDAMAMETKMHTIVLGDNFWNLARTYYGDARKWHMIADANPDARARQLRVGAEITVPPAK
ncbi:MAG: 5'-nucleotidase C-terminal domain-containing protein [Rhizobiaceae bacterium]